MLKTALGLSHIVPQEMREIVLRLMGKLDMALGLFRNTTAVG